MRSVPFVPGSRRAAAAVGAVLLAAGLVGCEMVGDAADLVASRLHTVEVVNLCGGSNAFVDVYIDDALRGTVYLRRSFTVLSGSRAFRAIGTGPYGTTFRNSTYVRDDLEWTLCPRPALRADADDGENGDRQMLRTAGDGEVPDANR